MPGATVGIEEDSQQLVFVTPDGAERRMTVADFRLMPGGVQNYLAEFVVNGRFEVHYDTIINAAGTAQTVGGTTDVLKTGIGENGVVWNTAATFVKTDYHTSAGAEGAFGFEQAGILTGIELLYIPYPAKAATVGSSSTIGQVTDSADHATQPTGYNPLALCRAVLFQNRWQWQWGENDLGESGQFWEIPSSFALSGFAGAATATLAQNANAVSKVRGLSKAKTIRRTERGWFVRLKSQSALAMPVDLVAQMLFRTVEIGARRND